ncbi:MAG: MaoC/PaaZ C-terminal domain-containing protein [Microthrixaceae bacterium]
MGVEDLADRLPMELGRSDPVVIDQQMVDVHAATTGDAQWIHNDPERAQRESPFGGPVVQGFLLLSLLTRLSSGLRFPEYGGVQMLVNYGFDRVRFVAPVPVGAAVRLTGRLAEVRPRGDGSGVLGVDVELHVDGAAAPSVVARWLFHAVPSPD